MDMSLPVCHGSAGTRLLLCGLLASRYVLSLVHRSAAPDFVPRGNPRANAMKAARTWLERKHLGQRTSMEKLCAEFDVKSTRSVMLAKDELVRTGAAAVLLEALKKVEVILNWQAH